MKTVTPFFVFLLFAFSCKKSGDSTCPAIHQLTSMHTQWLDSVINYNFYYNDSNYVIEIVEIKLKF